MTPRFRATQIFGWICGRNQPARSGYIDIIANRDKPPFRSAEWLFSVRYGSSSGAISPSMRPETSSLSSSSSSRKVSSSSAPSSSISTSSPATVSSAASSALDLVERNQLHARFRFFLVLFDGRRAARASGCLLNGAALRTDDRILVQVEELRAALLAGTLVTELEFRHGLASKDR